MDERHWKDLFVKPPGGKMKYVFGEACSIGHPEPKFQLYLPKPFHLIVKIFHALYIWLRNPILSREVELYQAYYMLRTLRNEWDARMKLKEQHRMGTGKLIGEMDRWIKLTTDHVKPQPPKKENDASD